MGEEERFVKEKGFSCTSDKVWDRFDITQIRLLGISRFGEKLNEWIDDEEEEEMEETESGDARILDCRWVGTFMDSFDNEGEGDKGQ